jgi:hypothetical protein
MTVNTREMLNLIRLHGNRLNAAEALAKGYARNNPDAHDLAKSTIYYFFYLALFELYPHDETKRGFPGMFSHFEEITRPLAEEDRYLFCYGLLTFAPLNVATLSEGFYAMLKYVNGLRYVQGLLKPLHTQHPKLELYRGVVAEDDGRAKELLTRPFWATDENAARGYKQPWQEQGAKGNFYVGELKIDSSHVLVPLVRDPQKRYGFGQLLIDVTAINSANLRVFPDQASPVTKNTIQNPTVV